ncbi:hypothetical protein PF005_g27218 [Phytophthora fragariae]|nr:hypothetical protein PR001_g23534 [Phytophthora rubi]KAE9171254.1 hypothetical protein PF005_g27218 [Phytophthora fragariae]KAE9214158.1 hypothetical protein PF004_g15121 [Phytophthora fragariae]KAE9288657.1 hypothetical protein PF008_g26081 [Phytophthora fragariae]
MTQEICRYCRTQVCEDCYVAATSKTMTSAHQQHVCLSCSRLQPEAKTPPRDRRLGRVNSVPISGAPLIDSLSKGTRESCGRVRVRSSQSSSGFLSAQDQQETARVSRRGTSPKSVDFDLPSVDPRRRRHTSAIASTARSCDVTRPGRGLSARQLQRAHSADEYMIARRQANATELHTSRRSERAAPTLNSCKFTRTTPRMPTRVATHAGSKSQSCALTGGKPSMNLSDTADLRLPKYKASLPAPRKHGRRVSVAEIDSSGKLELEHLDSPAKETRNQPEQLNVPSSSKRGNHRTEPIDFHLSTVGLEPRSRPRRHTTPEAPQKLKDSRQGNQELNVAAQDRRGRITPFQRQKGEPVDFHLSRFGLMPRRHTTDARPETNNQNEVDRRQSRIKKVETVATSPEVTTPTSSKNKLCDLTYLENFRSYTV